MSLLRILGALASQGALAPGSLDVQYLLSLAAAVAAAALLAAAVAAATDATSAVRTQVGGLRQRPLFLVP
jgi:hypothetical protein